MLLLALLTAAVAALTAAAASIRSPQTPPYSNTTNSPLQVDLGYSIYHGYSDAPHAINVWKGIRYAQAPIGKLRWQAPREPVVNRSSIISATRFPPSCPQSPEANGLPILAQSQAGASEDCLFLNVYVPSNATSASPLPVVFSIHGGGYGEGDGTDGFQPLINTNGNQFIAVVIQYRLGAFGFLSSDEVYRKGVVNAGLLDQHLALQWVQKYIHLFNGDPRRVTIFGESAGGGSVMLQGMAYGGSLGSQLFQNSIAASPFLPMQWGYKDWLPSQTYYAFAAHAGCYSMEPYGAPKTTPIFECLQNAESRVLMNASATVSQLTVYGQWAFLPVTDGTFVQDLPSRQLLRNQVNGVNLLIGNNANEGTGFSGNIDTEEELVAWLKLTFPLFTNNDIARVLEYYPSTNASVNPKAPLFATNGISGPTAINQSSVETGQLQRADNIYAEITFDCPALWMAQAYSQNAAGGNSYKYQFSVLPSLHGDDTNAYLAREGPMVYSQDLTTAFRKIIGNFIIDSNPSISNQIANGVTPGAMTNASNPASNWPPYTSYQPYMIDLNATCGIHRHALEHLETCGLPGDLNNITLVNAYTWEGGRGFRCDFWRAMGQLVPE